MLARCARERADDHSRCAHRDVRSARASSLIAATTFLEIFFRARDFLFRSGHLGKKLGAIRIALEGQVATQHALLRACE
jgi:hypothetical protein